MKVLRRILSDWLGAKQRVQADYPKTRLVAVKGEIECGIERPTRGRNLFTVAIEGRVYSNSKLGDLKHQLGQLGYTVHRIKVD